MLNNRPHIKTGSENERNEDMQILEILWVMLLSFWILVTAVSLYEFTKHFWRLRKERIQWETSQRKK